MTLHTTTNRMFTYIYPRGICIGSSCLCLVLYIFTGPGTVVLCFIWALSSTLQLHHTIPLLTSFRKRITVSLSQTQAMEAGEYHGEVTLNKTKKGKAENKSISLRTTITRLLNTEVDFQQRCGRKVWKTVSYPSGRAERRKITVITTLVRVCRAESKSSQDRNMMCTDRFPGRQGQLENPILMNILWPLEMMGPRGGSVLMPPLSSPVI